MKRVTIYGFKCLKKDEKILMKRINDFLATHNRTTSRSKNPSLLSAYAPLTLKHFYWNLNKEMGTWFDVYPNEDINGEYFFPERKDCGWLMYLTINLKRHANIVKENSEAFVAGVLGATQFEHAIIRESDDLLLGLTRQGEPGTRPVA